MFVLGTAGHVDHGKSTLVRLLTAQEPDRLPEEKRRGMTIDLNFLWYLSQKFGKVGIVDVPGHQRFVKTMISGDSLIDGFLFVVAADDGWMPQSEEHLAVLQGLGVREGLVLISKKDLVDENHFSEVVTEVRERFLARGYRDIEVVGYGATGEGVRALLLSEVERLLVRLGSGQSYFPPRAPRLWIDRVFQPKGQGVVVTGTLREGSLMEGMELTLYPTGQSTLVKTLQAYGKGQKRVESSSRVAIQLGKLSLEQVKRGLLLTSQKNVILADAIDLVFTPLRPGILKRDVEVKLSLGTRVQKGRVRALLSLPDGRSVVRLTFKQKGAFRYLEHVVLRTSGEEKTLGTATIIDADAKVVKASKVKEHFDESAMDPTGNFTYLAKVHGVVNERLYQANSLGRAQTRELVDIEEGWFADPIFLEQCRKAGTKRERRQLSEVGLAHLDRALQTKGESDFSKEETALLGALRGKLEPVDLSELLRDSKKRDCVTKLIADKKIVRFPGNRFLEFSCYKEYIERITALLREKGAATTSELRELIQLNRNNTVLILEKADSDRITYLKDGVRRLLKTGPVGC